MPYKVKPEHLTEIVKENSIFMNETSLVKSNRHSFTEISLNEYENIYNRNQLLKDLYCAYRAGNYGVVK